MIDLDDDFVERLRAALVMLRSQYDPAMFELREIKITKTDVVFEVRDTRKMSFEAGASLRLGASLYPKGESQ